MGAKASTAGNQSPRTFSNSSSSDVVSAGNNATSFNFLRAINGVENVSSDSRQRARSMSAMPDLDIHHHPVVSSSSSSSHHHHHHHHNQNINNQSLSSNNNNNSSLNHNHHYHHNHQQYHNLPQNAFSHVQHNSQPSYEVANGFPHAGAGAHFDLSNSPEESNSHDESNQMHPLGIGRVVATSLPSHIWSLNGE